MTMYICSAIQSFLKDGMVTRCHGVQEKTIINRKLTKGSLELQYRSKTLIFVSFPCKINSDKED